MQVYPTAKWGCKKEKQAYCRSRTGLDSVHTDVYIMNRTPTTAVHGMTPEERFTGKKLDVSHLKVFECIAYVHEPNLAN